MFRRKRSERDFNAEIEAHIRLEAERLREQGLSEEDARAAARRAFGNVTQAQERFYEASRWVSSLGLLATWIPAQRALSINPAILLREE